MAQTPLGPKAVRRTSSRLMDDLGRADRIRLESLVGLLADRPRIALDAALNALFSDQPREAALTAFRQFRSRLREAAAEAGLRFALEVDSQTRASPEDRWCWFEGEDSAAEAFERRTDEETADVARVGQSGVELTDLRDGKPVIRYFVSYAHADKVHKDKLLDKLQTNLSLSKHYCFEPWEDADILPGDDWHARIQAAIARCQVGLLLVSPKFLASLYISQHELPAFVPADPSTPETGKRAIPVALKRLLFDGTMDLKGLESRQVFHDANGKAFQERSNDKTQEDFARELFQQIQKVVARHVAPKAAEASVRPGPSQRLELAQRRHIETAMDWDCHVPTQGFSSSLDKMESERSAKPPPDEQRTDALAFLDEWIANPQAQPYCALLGDLGMGKTTTCMAFARVLLDRRKADPAAPLPIYLDLRHLGDKAKDEPGLKLILETLLARSWRGGHGESDVSADEAIRLVQQEGAVAIFDGLDEVLVHLTKAAGQRFVREIFRILPPLRAKAKTKGPSIQEYTVPSATRPGRLLIACRTHYFRTLREQKSFLTGEDREGIRADDYRAFVLLPFTEAQIRNYLRQSLPDEDPDRILDLIRAVHDLTEMAERPYTLSLISRHIQQIERWMMEGRAVSGILLYRQMVLSWLERDDGKHQILTDHKLRLMEHLAAELWRAGQRVWSVGELEQWLVDFLEQRPAIAAHYVGKDRELLKEDLRTATFLVREGEDRFRFAHASLQEFFLAGYLLDALRRGESERWALPHPSPETLDFLGQMILEGETKRDKILDTLRNLRDTYRPRASELAFSYFLTAQRRSYPAPPAAGFQLAGAELRELEIHGIEGAPRVNLRGADFRGSRLSGASLFRLDLENADFRNADLSRSEWLSVNPAGTRFEATNVTGTLFRQCNLTATNFSEAKFHRTLLLDCQMGNALGVVTGAPTAFAACCELPELHPSFPEHAGARLQVLDGHCDGVNACAVTPDGRQIVSASGDATLRLWDTDSGQCLAVLRGHEGVVSGCAFAPDGRRLFSASWDRTLRLWDTDSGQCLAVLKGHEDGVSGCAFAPDGRHLVSASWDRTLRLWETDSGQCLAVLHGHEDSVSGCAFAPDGRHLASASSDKALRLWDTDSGQCLAVFQGHEESVWGCAFAPDGRRLVSTSLDKTLRLWDTDSGQCLAVLQGHEAGISGCAFAPDGRRLASASWDGTLRLWDADSGEYLAVLQGHENTVWGCAFAPDGRRIVSASSDRTVRLWDTDSGQCLAVLQGHEDSVSGCAFAPDGRRLGSASSDGILRLWDTDSGQCLAVLQGHEGRISGCAFAPDGRRLLSASWDRTLRLWDTHSGQCLAVLQGHEGRVSGCAFAPDGRRIVSASWDRTLRLWDTDSDQCLAVLKGHEDSVSGCALAPDGRRIVSASLDRTLRLWDTDSGQALAVLQGHKGLVSGCAFDPDGRRIASASIDQTVRLWDANEGKCLATLQGHDDLVWDCAFSPDGQRIASASEDHTLRLWNADSGKCLAVLRGHEGRVSNCAFSPDGRRIVSISSDGSLRFWDAATGCPLGRQIRFFLNGAWASIDLYENRIIQVSGDAWRWLGWRAPDPVTGRMETWPAEIFGPLPTCR